MKRKEPNFDEQEDADQDDPTCLDWSDQDLGGISEQDLRKKFSEIDSKVTSLNLASNDFGCATGYQWDVSSLASVFDSLPPLNDLDISYNALSELCGNESRGESRSGLREIFRNLPEVEHLNISFNGLAATEETVKALQYMHQGIVSLTVDKTLFTQLTPEQLHTLAQHFGDLENIIIADPLELKPSRAMAGKFFFSYKHKIFYELQQTILYALATMIADYLHPLLTYKSWQACLEDIEKCLHSDFILLAKQLMQVNSPLSKSDITNLIPYAEVLSNGLEIADKYGFNLPMSARLPNNALVQVITAAAEKKSSQLLSLAGKSCAAKLSIALIPEEKQHSHAQDQSTRRKSPSTLASASALFPMSKSPVKKQKINYKQTTINFPKT